jgi:hypothetical protein|tara:strand:+ start:526 stop:765 length:240 start_codon:yes stop_codon:yes gene_type:complete
MPEKALFMIPPMRNQTKIKKYLPADPAYKGKRLYIVYKFDIQREEMISDGPYLEKDDAYKKMNGFLKKGICSWVVVYNG